MSTKTKLTETKAYKSSKYLKWIGNWATWWWGLSCFYVLLLVWFGKSYYVNMPAKVSQGFLADWQSSIASGYRHHEFMPWLLLTIIVGWLVCGAIWLQELKRSKIPYRTALRDLFLTIRR